MPLKFIPTNVKYNDSGEFKNISIPADRAYMNEAITISSTQPTNSDNKLWINTNEQTKQTYQIPTMTDMETADNTILGNLAMIESSPTTAAHTVGEYIVYNGQLYKVTVAIAAEQTLTVGTNIAATNTSESFLPKGSMVDITDQCQISTGTIAYVRYYQTDRIIVLAVQVFNINFTGVNVWLQLPDSFPGDANVFTALATGFDGMECVFRTQSGSGKYLLIQSTQQGSYNLTGTGICFT